ncbi:hypothetical protein [Streptomyces sp. AB3(2024)]|uniref:ATP-dependent DNA ligase n=1 Tax=Streptomyces sp. AB3(2024) TaxID=3317321 RepID=UPI0035A34246
MSPPQDSLAPPTAVPAPRLRPNPLGVNQPAHQMGRTYNTKVGEECRTESIASRSKARSSTGQHSGGTRLEAPGYRKGTNLSHETQRSLENDGHRLLVFTPAGPGGRVLLQTRRGALIQDAFPDLVTAAAQLPDGLVLDGEVLAWDVEAGALSFEGLQRPAAARALGAPALAVRLPAFYVAFDILMADGTELLTLPYEERRRRLEVLFASRALTSPWTL